MTGDLVTFVRARLDEREAAIRATGPAQLAWAMLYRDDGSLRHSTIAAQNGDVWVANGEVIDPTTITIVFDPVSELADVAAKRRLIGEILDYESRIDGEWGCSHDAEAIAAGKCRETNPNEITGLRLLALPDAGHPEYREEWRL